MSHMSNTLTVRLPDELRARVEELAQREDRSAGSVIRRAVDLYTSVRAESEEKTDDG